MKCKKCLHKGQKSCWDRWMASGAMSRELKVKPLTLDICEETVVGCNRGQRPRKKGY
jgi:hypothetical protein